MGASGARVSAPDGPAVIPFDLAAVMATLTDDDWKRVHHYVTKQSVRRRLRRVEDLTTVIAREMLPPLRRITRTPAILQRTDLHRFLRQCPSMKPVLVAVAILHGRLVQKHEALLRDPGAPRTTTR